MTISLHPTGDARLTQEDLGELRACNSCGNPTYHKESKPKESRWRPGTGQILPTVSWNGEDYKLTAVNERRYIWYKGSLLTLCCRCRYSAPYEGY